MSDTLEHRSYTFRVEIERDNDHGAPWEENDGHGIVSKWTTRSKAPSERILASDRSSHRFYDVQATMPIAIRDGWGVEGGKRDGETDRAYAARAVDKDYEYLYGWCNDDWYYVGVVVRHGTEVESLWGIESNAGEYLNEVARELADEIADRLDTAKAQAWIDYGIAYGCSL